MSETPNNPAGHLTEIIMATVRPFLQVDESQPARIYNETYRAVYAVLAEKVVGQRVVPASPKKVVTFSKGSFKTQP
jgi:hypothetical protein